MNNLFLSGVSELLLEYYELKLAKKAMTWAEQTLMRVSQELFLYEDGRDIQPDVIESLCLQLELVFRDFVMQVR